ncbi:MAG TPA: ADOP family duplicated permease [Vicinamibacterales bacterium]|nr:ADOP family duplicated permease [Vicinamibacterales bacterium]
MTPPRLARLWVRLVAPPKLRQAILDDLDELMRADAASPPFAALTRARLRYWREALRGTPHLLRLRVMPARQPPGSATADPRRAVGDIRFGSAWKAGGIDWLWRDIKYGLRGLRREPTFALTATLTLALGVTTTTTVFSVVDAEVWKPLPFPHPEQLVAVYSREPNGRADAISGAEFLDWRSGAPAFSDLAGESHTARQVLRLETAESVIVTKVSGNFFATLGRRAILGRTFRADDARGSRPAVLTDRTWRRLFAADPSVTGRTVTLDAETFVITGVVAADDSLGGDPDLFVALDETDPAFLDRTQPAFFSAIGRLRPGGDAAVARVQLQAVVTRLAEGTPGGRGSHSIVVADLQESLPDFNRRPLYFFLGGSLIVLILSAVNVATLLLARAFRRTREFALRGALGGGQTALARQLLVEGALLALPAAAGAVLMTRWAVGLFTGQLPADFFTRGTSIPIDLRVCAFALSVTGLTTVVFVLAPLVMARRVDLSSALAPGARAGHSAAEGHLRGLLLMAQMALTVVLLAGAGIFVKSFVALTHVPLGFDPTNAMAVRATLSGPRYASEAAVRAYADRLVEAARAIPGVQDAAIGTSSPLGSGPVVNFAAAGQPRPEPGKESDAILRAASPDYFRTLGMRIVRGRAFSTADVAGAPRVAVVNESVARETFGDENPIGRIIELLPRARTPWTNRPGALMVVGVVATVKDVGVNEIEFGNIYVPFAQMTAPRIELVVRAGVPPADVMDPLRHAVARIDPAVPVTSAATFDQRVASTLQNDRFNLLLISSFAGVALFLAAIGVYGAVAYHVQARTRELGVRLALGARPSRLIGAALWQTGRLGVLGGLLGVGVALAIARAIGNALYLVPGSHNGLLYGVTTTDPVMLGGAFVGIVVVALAAGTIPARRVTRIDPVRALSSE